MKKEDAADPGASGRVFDPFRDRVSRDIRNTLSEAFVAAWSGNGEDYTEVAAALRKRYQHPVYRTYIDQRMADYRAALEDRRELAAPGLLDEMVVLWNRQLFFEVHELLEGHWHVARGARREVLQALIQTAAVFVHRQAGREAAAEQLGRRVSLRLEALRPHLGTIANLDELSRALATPASRPPSLRGNTS